MTSQRYLPSLLDQLADARKAVVRAAELVAVAPGADRWLCDRLTTNAAQAIAELEAQARKHTAHHPELVP